MGPGESSRIRIAAIRKNGENITRQIGEISRSANLFTLSRALFEMPGEKPIFCFFSGITVSAKEKTAKRMGERRYSFTQ